MAVQLQLRKGTKLQNDAFTGAEAELTYVSDTNGLRIHDGTTQGGFEVPVLVDVQRPSSLNNYTWYRKYSDGWVEQGGITTDNEGTVHLLPVEMSDANYTLIVMNKTVGSYYARIVSMTTTGFIADPSVGSSTKNGIWFVSGMAA